MKTNKICLSVLVAGALAFASCSSTSNNGASETATSSAADTRMGTDMNPTPASDANSGVAPNSATTDANADPTAFMGTFATMQDPVFLMNAASSNMLEVRAGQMAAQKATSPDVRKFAQTMVSQHMTGTQELKAIAMPLGVKMPATMMPVHQAMADRLMNKNGKAFDEAYMDLMEEAHKMDIAMFEVKSKAAETPAVQAYASKMLPTLQAHQAEASALEKKVD